MNLLELKEFPPSSCDSIRQWVDEIASEFWQDYADFLDLHIQTDCQQPKLPALEGVGWHKLTDWYWEPCNMQELPLAVTLDVEAHRNAEDSPYLPVLALAYGFDALEMHTGRWYAWKGEEGVLVIPYPGGRVVMGHNVAAHDSRYLSCEYSQEGDEMVVTADHHRPANIVYIDTQSLATMTRGLNGSTMESLYQKCQSHISSGHQAPAWYEHAWQVSLKELAKRLLGIDLVKGIDRDAFLLEELKDQYAGKDLLNYCALDVWIAHQIGRKLYPIVDKQFFQSPASWVGMTSMAQCKIWLKDWDGFLEQCDQEFNQVKQDLADLIRDLATEATKEEYPHWDWSILSRGQFKGYPRWKQELEKGGYSLGTRMATELLALRWDGEAIEWEQVNSRVGQWVTKTGREPLPHPDGNARLGDPLCAGYLGFAVSGRLTSEVLEQDGLIEVYEALVKIGQWANYRSRYHGIYRPYRTDDGLDVVKPDINPCGTLTRRAKSPIWTVTPKERQGRIGSHVQRHIVAPPGYSIVYADFDSQESWLMTLLTDAQCGQIASNEWCRAVLYGDKAQGTDIHSLSAQRFGIPRDVGKTINFASGYLCGVIKLANTLWTSLKDCSYEQAEEMATEFLQWLKGEGGIANTTFATLKKLATTAHVRTAILGVKIPDSINAAWCSTEFMTTRQNWQIQSPGVDCLHALIVLTKAFFLEHEVQGDLMLHRHDAVYWLVRQGQEELAQQCLQTAHHWVKRLAYECASKHAYELRKRDGYTAQQDVLTPPEHTLFFSSVDVGVSAGDF